MGVDTVNLHRPTRPTRSRRRADDRWSAATSLNVMPPDVGSAAQQGQMVRSLNRMGRWSGA